MIDMDKIIKSDNMDELKQIKVWLFQEILRLENARAELQDSQDRFIKERVQFRDEMDKLNRRTVTERKRLKEESLFFEKKLAILQDGFRQLDADRRKFEKDKRLYQRQQSERRYEYSGEGIDESLVSALFRNTNNILALRKRYKDLVKIYHPDNLFGDEELMQAINREYARRRNKD